MKKPFINPYLAVMVGVLAVSFSALFVKLSSAPSIIIGVYRLLFTFIILLPFGFKAKFEELNFSNRKDILMAGASGIFLALHFIFWFTSLKYTSIASSVVLVTTQPLFVVLGSWVFLKETLPKKAIIGGALALVGSIYIGATDFTVGPKALFGDILALIGAILVSCYLLIGRTLRARMSVGLYTLIAYGSSTITLVLAALIFGHKFYPYPPKEWGLFLALAVVCQIFGHTVFNWVLSYVPATVVSVGILGEPLGAMVWAFTFLGESPSLRQIFGSSVILFGLYIFTVSTRNNLKAT